MKPTPGLQSSADAVFWSLVLIAGIALLGTIVFFVRRLFFSDRQAPRDEGFSLQQLREMHAKGQINDAEFEQLKASMLGDAGAASSRKDRPRSDAPRSFHPPRNQIKRPSDRSR